MIFRFIKVIILIGAVSIADLIFFSSNVKALPFNTDMMSTQPANGRITRPRPAGSIQNGAGERFVGTREEAVSLVNPIISTPLSVVRGNRLYHANCSPCHGRHIDGKTVPGAVSTMLPGPDLSMDIYKSKSDSHFFQFIHFGGMAIMPAYASKFSISEHWDIVNYIRSIQNQNDKK